MIKDLTTGRLVKRDDHTDKGGFTTATLSYDSQSLSFINIQVHIIAGCQCSATGSRELFYDMFCTEHDIGFLKHNAVPPFPALQPAVSLYSHWSDDS